MIFFLQQTPIKYVTKIFKKSFQIKVKQIQTEGGVEKQRKRK